MPFSELIFSVQVILDNNEILEPCFFLVYLCQSIILIWISWRKYEAVRKEPTETLTCIAHVFLGTSFTEC